MTNIKKNQRGNSLIESMVVLSLAMLMFIAIWGIYNITQKSYLISTGREELVQNSRIIMDRLTREIRQTDEFVTALPAVNDHSVHEIKFRDAHNNTSIEYIRYYLSGDKIYRELSYYDFPPDLTRVHWNTTSGGNPATNHINGDPILIGEYVSQLDFWGELGFIGIDLTLNNGGRQINTTSKILSRNTRSNP
jgi:type II secretory pathway component PulJ